MEATIKKDIANFLVRYFSSVYCDTCAHPDEEVCCEGCHRKSMYWGLNPSNAEYVAEEILKIIEKKESAE